VINNNKAMATASLFDILDYFGKMTKQQKTVQWSNVNILKKGGGSKSFSAVCYASSIEWLTSTYYHCFAMKQQAANNQSNVE